VHILPAGKPSGAGLKRCLLEIHVPKTGFLGDELWFLINTATKVLHKSNTRIYRKLIMAIYCCH
jgi:hypothetical protein